MKYKYKIYNSNNDVLRNLYVQELLDTFTTCPLYITKSRKADAESTWIISSKMIKKELQNIFKSKSWVLNYKWGDGLGLIKDSIEFARQNVCCQVYFSHYHHLFHDLVRFQEFNKKYPIVDCLVFVCRTKYIKVSTKTMLYFQQAEQIMDKYHDNFPFKCILLGIHLDSEDPHGFPIEQTNPKNLLGVPTRSKVKLLDWLN
jgi:Restriction endonuclease BglII